MTQLDVTPPVRVGDQAPDFELPDQHGTPTRLSSWRGSRAVVLVFYPHVFTPTCNGELSTLRDEQARFDPAAVQLLGVSCDPVSALRAFADREQLGYPLLSDFWPHGAVAQQYGVFVPERGFATRGTFVIDRAGRVAWAVVNGPGQARDPADYSAALAAL